MNTSTQTDLAASQQDRACQRLRDDILDGELPPLSKLQISDLKDRYDTSVGPIREALSRLAGEGLVIKKGQRGHWVAPVSVDEFQEITRLRIMLEVDALRQSIGRGDLEWEAGVVGALHRLKTVQMQYRDDVKSFARANDLENIAFHRALISRCPSEWQLRFISTLYDQTARYRRLSLRKQDAVRDPEQTAHTEIMQAALARDGAKACECLTEHIKHSTRKVITNVFAQQAKARAAD